MRTAAEHGALVERLLDDVEATAGPVAWPRVEALVTGLVELYGEAMERLLGHARGAARDPADFDALVRSDELVASLLALRDVPPYVGLAQHEPGDHTPLISPDRLVRSHRP